MDVPAVLRWLGHDRIKTKSKMPVADTCGGRPVVMVRGDLDHGGFLLDGQWMVSSVIILLFTCHLWLYDLLKRIMPSLAQREIVDNIRQLAADSV